MKLMRERIALVFAVVLLLQIQPVAASAVIDSVSIDAIDISDTSDTSDTSDVDANNAKRAVQLHGPLDSISTDLLRTELFRNDILQHRR